MKELIKIFLTLGYKGDYNVLRRYVKKYNFLILYI